MGNEVVNKSALKHLFALVMEERMTNKSWNYIWMFSVNMYSM